MPEPVVLLKIKLLTIIPGVSVVFDAPFEIVILELITLFSTNSKPSLGTLTFTPTLEEEVLVVVRVLETILAPLTVFKSIPPTV